MYFKGSDSAHPRLTDLTLHGCCRPFPRLNQHSALKQLCLEQLILVSIQCPPVCAQEAERLGHSLAF